MSARETGNRLMDFFEELLAWAGSEVDRVSPTRIELIPSPAAAAFLGCGEDLVALTGGAAEDAPDAIPVNFHGKLFENAETLLGENGRFVGLATPPFYLKKERVAEAVERCFTLTRGQLRVTDSRPATVPYYLFHFSCEAVSEDRRELINRVAVNGHTLSTPRGLPPKMENLASVAAAEPRPEETLELVNQASSAAMDRVLAAARREAEKNARAELEPFLASLNRRMSRDAFRLHDYYYRIKQKLELELAKKKHDAQWAARQSERIHATETELDRKLRDLGNRYLVKADMRLIAAARLDVRSLLIQCEARYKKDVLRFDMTWNPIIKDVERPSCNGCGAEMAAASVCGNGKHLVCAQCASPCPDCGRQRCAACSPSGCLSCAAKSGN